MYRKKCPYKHSGETELAVICLSNALVLYTVHAVVLSNCWRLWSTLQTCFYCILTNHGITELIFL